MNIYPNDELPSIIGGDTLIYMYAETIIYPAFIPYFTDEAGNTYNHFVGEKIQTALIARVEGDSFYVKWAIGGTLPALIVLENGIILKDEVTARRLFPRLIQYKFKGEPHGSATNHPG